MEKIKSLLAKINRRDLENSTIFSLGFLLGSGGDIAGAIFFAVFWYVGAFIGSKFFESWNQKR